MKKANLFLGTAAAVLGSTVIIVPVSIVATKTPKEVGPVGPINPIITIEQQKNILGNELEKINTLEIFEVAKNTLPSQVNNQNITDFIKVPVSSNGVSFSIKISETASGSDTSGFVVVTLVGSIGDLTQEKTIIVNGFRVLSPEEIQEQINIAVDRDIQNELNTISSLSITDFGKTPAWSNDVWSIDKIVNTPNPQNGVQFSLRYVQSSVHFGEGRLSVVLIGSKNGRILEKTIVVTGFPGRN
ncbi:lipoprotein 17-related variable surface protein [[Mycoplasma] mobile]|uniref:Variable surface protein mvspM n=1 Tax=Mycoplasma mobile (strain ATCC 43663 / 163K / NCTC 11711) TaxID=267748 RepID=Q6KH38_MYCM1|nr:lipoprotein 17-related variable surface protein [[Mycoplasma] mobile]AAT28093.1 variable surface protein mvspM [Mycoplasma mobile 163K]